MRLTTLTAFLLALLGAVGCYSGSTLTYSEKAEWGALYELQSNSHAEQSVCQVHHQPLEATTVPGYGGFSVMPPDDYVRARIARFPHSWLYVNTGFCEQAWVSVETRYTCRQCRRVELEWRRLNGYGLPREIAPVTGDWIESNPSLPNESR